MRISFAVLVGSVMFSVASPVAAQDDTYAKLDVMATLETMAKAYVKKDMATLESLFHRDLSYGHTDGHTESKAEVLDVVRARATDSLEFSGTKVTVSGNLALVRGVAHMKTGGPKPNVSNRGVLWVLVKGDGPSGWQIIARQNWPLPN